jgi:hypothetical protein
MFRMSILQRSLHAARAGLVLLNALVPAHAAQRHHAAASVFPDVAINATADHDSAALTSHLPWLAPVGHRQPRQGDVPQHDAVSVWEREQRQADQELDRKLIICRGC